MNEITSKKVDQKIEIAFKFKWKIPYKLIGPRKKIIREFPLNLLASLARAAFKKDLPVNWTAIKLKGIL